MKITRFIANDMRSALRKVSETLGPDAVILSNNRVDEGVEIVAAIDYDESLFQETEKQPQVKKQTVNPFLQDDEDVTRAHIEQRNREAALDDIRYGRNIPEIRKFETEKTSVTAAAPEKAKDHLWSQQPAFMEMQSELKSLRGMLVNQLSGLSWGNEVQYHPLRARLLQRLISLGLSPKLAKDIATQVNEEKDFEHNWRLALGELAHRIPTGENEIIEKGGVVALVGATGVGKTTTIAKLAARYTLKHGPHRVALITTDNFRVAAHEQLRSYARIMGVPMRVTGDVESLRAALDSLSDKELILIDTAGMSQRDMTLNKQLTMLQAEALPQIKTYLTLATNSQRGVLQEINEKFKEMPLAGCILTKIDETTSMGGALSVAVEHNLPISYLCDGQRVPEDLHLARAHSLVSRSVAIMQHMASIHSHDETTSLTIGGMVANGYG
jgi:flagellar biosynthesis protein FlhF